MVPFFWFKAVKKKKRKKENGPKIATIVNRGVKNSNASEKLMLTTPAGKVYLRWGGRRAKSGRGQSRF